MDVFFVIMGFLLLTLIGVIFFSIGQYTDSAGLITVGIIAIVASSILGPSICYTRGWKEAEIHMKTGGEGRYVLTTQPDKSVVWERKKDEN